MKLSLLMFNYYSYNTHTHKLPHEQSLLSWLQLKLSEVNFSNWKRDAGFVVSSTEH